MFSSPENPASIISSRLAAMVAKSSVIVLVQQASDDAKKYGKNK
jgi:hypothetical protein